MLQIGPSSPPVDEGQNNVGEGEDAWIGKVGELHRYPAEEDVNQQEERIDPVGVNAGRIDAGVVAALGRGGARGIGRHCRKRGAPVNEAPVANGDHEC